MVVKVKGEYVFVKNVSLKGINGENIIYDDIAVKGLADSLDSLYKRIDFNKISSLDNIILDAYASATIEGAVTTVDRVKASLRRRCYDKGTKMATNCVRFVQGASKLRFSEDWLLDCWRGVVDGVCENTNVLGYKYRNGMVYVGSHTPAKVDIIQDCMDSLFNYIRVSDSNPFILSAIAHFYFVYVHPFCDGNGRTARILSSKILYDRGYKNIFKIPISNAIMNSVNYYYKWINICEGTMSVGGTTCIDITPFISYMLSVYEYAFNSVLKGDYSELEVSIFNLMKKHAGAEITVRKVADTFEVSESKARDTLNDMVARGTLVKRREGNRYFYRVNVFR